MVGDIHGWQHAGRIAGVNSSFFDMLHDSADDDVLAIRERIYVNFDRVLKKVVDKDGAVVRVLDCLFHVVDDTLFIVGDHHGAATEHIRWPHEHGISDTPRAFHSFFDRRRHCTRRLRDFEFFEEPVEAFAVFGKVD